MASVTGTLNWQNYPSCLSERSGVVELDSLREKLIQDAPRLFAGQGDIEVWFRNGQNEEPIVGTFQQHNVDEARDCMYFIHQKSSWSHLETSLETVQKLFTAHSVSPAILDVIHSFGAKVTGDDDPYFSSVSFKFLTPRNRSKRSHSEICYLLRSFERHGRSNLKDPWSSRQMAVYQKYDINRNRSVWIFIQPFRRFRDALWNDFARSGPSTHPLAIHTHVLALEAANWRWYLNDLRFTTSTFAEKAKHSSIKPEFADYNTSFADLQRLHTVTEKLSVAQAVLSANSAIASLIRKHCADFEEYSDDTPKIGQSTDILDCVENSLSKLQSSTVTARALQQRAAGVERLLSQLLSYKRIDLLNDHVSALRTLTTQVHDQGTTLRELAEKSRKDSHSMKIVTFVATIYLPANLIAQLFSTPLIQLPEIGVSPRILSVHTGIWIYIISSVLLAALTLMVTKLAGNRK